jgi:serine/threonine protein kinase
MTDFTGQDFDRYHILEPLGEGGMASVYKAYDTRLERDVAVKIIRTDMFIPATLQQVLKRFEREAKSLAKLSHPNIVHIIDYGEHEGVPYLVMEYLPGGTLKDRLKGQPLAWQESFRLLLPVARALHFAHQQGIVHRDVKPSNILITLSDEPMLSDFGIAKILESDKSTALTGTGAGIGTPEYMAPEQWVGKTSPQTDIYSLGVVLYEMLTGHKPYTADTPAAILLKQANDPLPRPRKFAPDLPDGVEKVILKSMAKNPESRYGSMGEFYLAMDVLLTGSAKKKQPSSSAGREKPIRIHQPAPGAADLQPPAPRPPEVPPPLPTPVEVQPTLPEGEQVKPQAPKPEKIQPPTPEAAEIYPPASKSGEVELPEPEPVAARLSAEDIPTLLVSAQKKAEPHALVAPVQTGVEAIPTPKPPPLEWLLRMVPKIRPAAWIAILVGFLAVIALTIFLGHSQRASPVSLNVSSNYVYFASDESGQPEVYYLTPQGLKKQVTYTQAPHGSWSPIQAANGYVYFTSDESSRPEVYYLTPQGLKKQVTFTTAPHGSWSPSPAANGYIYFTSDESGRPEVYYLTPQGIKKQVTYTQASHGSWSPVLAANGYVYFTSDESGQPEVYYLTPQGLKKQVTYTQAPHGSWSPVLAANGYVYFTSDESGQPEVYYLTPQGLKQQVTHTLAPFKSWSPMPAADGYLYFTSNESGRPEVYYLTPQGIKKQVIFTKAPNGSWLKTLQDGSAATPN